MPKHYILKRNFIFFKYKTTPQCPEPPSPTCYTQQTLEHCQVLWPAAKKGFKWRQFNEDINATIEISSWGAVDQQLQTMCTLIISIGGERLGIKQPKVNNIARLIRRRIKITQLRKELKSLKKPLQSCGKSFIRNYCSSDMQSGIEKGTERGSI